VYSVAFFVLDLIWLSCFFKEGVDDQNQLRLCLRWFDIPSKQFRQLAELESLF